MTVDLLAAPPAIGPPSLADLAMSPLGLIALLVLLAWITLAFGSRRQ